MAAPGGDPDPDAPGPRRLRFSAVSRQVAESVIFEMRIPPGTGPWLPVAGVSPDTPSGEITDYGPRAVAYLFGWRNGHGPAIWQVTRGVMVTDRHQGVLPDGGEHAVLLDVKESDIHLFADLRRVPAASLVINTRSGRPTEIRFSYVRNR